MRAFLVALFFIAAMSGCAEKAVNGQSASRRVWEYKDRDVRAVLKELTMLTGDSVVIADDVHGSVDARLEDCSASEARRMIIKAKGLYAVEREGILYVMAKRQAGW